MNANEIQEGDKITLNYDNKEIVFKVVLKYNENNENQFKLFNKYVKSFFADIEFINKNLIK
jgi:ribosomal 50S subunit-recycling heat shock protein